MSKEFDKDNFANWMLDKIEGQKELFRQKNDQYGPRDPLANFRTAAKAEYGADDYQYMYKEARSFAMKHIAHLINCDIDGVKLSESLGDIAVYCLIMQYMVETNEQVL